MISLEDGDFGLVEPVLGIQEECLGRVFSLVKGEDETFEQCHGHCFSGSGLAFFWLGRVVGSRQRTRPRKAHHIPFTRQQPLKGDNEKSYKVEKDFNVLFDLGKTQGQSREGWSELERCRLSNTWAFGVLHWAKLQVASPDHFLHRSALQSRCQARSGCEDAEVRIVLLQSLAIGFAPLSSDSSDGILKD